MVFERPPGGRQFWRIFLDTNVLIAGTASKTGASAVILDLGEAGELLLVLSEHVLMEADRVLQKKFPHLLEYYRKFIRNSNILLAENPSVESIRATAKVISADDSPILAAAKREKVDYLVTLNTRHFAIPQVRAFLPTPIVTPGEFLIAFRNFWEQAT